MYVIFPTAKGYAPAFLRMPDMYRWRSSRKSLVMMFSLPLTAKTHRIFTCGYVFAIPFPDTEDGTVVPLGLEF